MAVSLVSTGVQFPDNSIQTTAATAGAAPGMTLISTISGASATTLQNLNAFSATYDNYLILANNITAASSNPVLQARIAIAGTVDSSGNYGGVLSTNVPGQGGQNSANQWDITSPTSNDSSRSISFRVFIWNVNSTTSVKRMDGQAYYQDSGANTRQQIASGGTFGVFSPVSALTGIQFFFQNGESFRAQGFIRIYGFKNS
jgi:hypothetical protein